jgi:endonuclease IV
MIYGLHVSKCKFGNIKDALYAYKDEYPSAKLAQIFVLGPQNSKLVNISEDDIVDIRKLKLDIYVHSSYLTHLFSDTKQIRTSSRLIVKKELEMADKLHAKGLVVHINDKASPQEIVRLLSKIELSDYKTPIYLENMYRTEYIHSFSNLFNLEHVFSLIDEVPNLKGRVRYCLDTSHLWAQGFPVDDNNILYEYLRVIKKYKPIVHLNDNSNQKGSLKDKHSSIGDGMIWRDSDSYKIVFDSGYPLIFERSSVSTGNEDIELAHKYK